MSSVSEVVLCAERVTRTFGGLVALQDVDLDVNSGEIVGLVGPNGSGKTTLLNVISGFLPPTAGHVSLGGARITGLTPERIARMGATRTFQAAATFPELTVIENVMTGMYAPSKASLGRPFKRRWRTREQLLAASELVDAVELSGKQAVPAARLGTGEQKHLGIALALATKPSLLLLDEPAAGMGDAEIERLMTLLRRLNADGLTLLVVEHHMELIMGICSRVVVLNAGRKIAEGPPDVIASDAAVIEAYLGRRRAERVASRLD